MMTKKDNKEYARTRAMNEIRAVCARHRVQLTANTRMLPANWFTRVFVKWFGRFIEYQLETAIITK